MQYIYIGQYLWSAESAQDAHIASRGALFNLFPSLDWRPHATRFLYAAWPREARKQGGAPWGWTASSLNRVCIHVEHGETHEHDIASLLPQILPFV
jgi:hypothetical protein